MVHFFAFFTLFHLNLTFSDRSFPLIADKFSNNFAEHLFYSVNPREVVT